jgi:hypothetical protein
VQNGAKAFLGDGPVEDSAAVEEMMISEPEKFSKGRQGLEVH